MFKRCTISKFVNQSVAGLLGFAVIAGVLLVTHADAQQPTTESKKNSDRQAFFGNLHIHTSWSIDAYVFGTHSAGPEEAILFAQGEPVRHPGRFKVQLKRPLDFMILMDHSE